MILSSTRAISVSWTGSTGHFQRQQMEGAGQNPSLSARHPPLAQQQSKHTGSGDSKANFEATAAKRGHIPTSPSSPPGPSVIQVEDLATLTAGQDPGKFGAWVLFFFERLAGVTPLRLLHCWIPAAGKRQECTCHLLQQRVLGWSCNVKLRPRSWGGGKNGEREKRKKKNKVPPG